jgi:hypothetical protein
MFSYLQTIKKIKFYPFSLIFFTFPLFFICLEPCSTSFFSKEEGLGKVQREELSGRSKIDSKYCINFSSEVKFFI